MHINSKLYIIKEGEYNKNNIHNDTFFYINPYTILYDNKLYEYSTKNILRLLIIKNVKKNEILDEYKQQIMIHSDLHGLIIANYVNDYYIFKIWIKILTI